MLVDAIRLKSMPRDYRRSLPAFDYLADLRRFSFTRPVTIFVGDNGIGKSSLLAAMATDLGCSPKGGRMGDPEAILPVSSVACECTELIQRAYFLRAETHEYLLSREQSPEETGGRSTLPIQVDVQARSHGESVFDVLYERVDGAGVYILDEPESGLSVVRQLALIAEIAQAVDRGAQVFIATHSPILLGCPNADIVELNDTGFQRISFDETEAVAATREFLEDPEGTINFILDPDAEDAEAEDAEAADTTVDEAERPE
ncbi:AAA family ATPase [Corynebacterium accolens]|uniref:AAA family ATPase n=1 Tax=Corynebacterium accolens TaxID=38284 RepID=A0ABT7FQ40_9CORY|nr:AAA family ATPase [Corynebacterium accolens]MDK4247712.1 AAA family ATPase [Corynebacterium accolens]MDK4323940.1 AAA family ATPase [Corynebacterium accolens]WKS55898.1 AAA family ATPase [Corynebacterium accolens]